MIGIQCEHNGKHYVVHVFGYATTDPTKCNHFVHSNPMVLDHFPGYSLASKYFMRYVIPLGFHASVCQID